MDILLTDLPQVCLEEIFKNLSYAEISRLGSVCKYFREVSKTIFRLYFKHQENIIEKEMEKIESEAAKSDKLTVDDHLHMALLHSVCLKIYFHILFPFIFFDDDQTARYLFTDFTNFTIRSENVKSPLLALHERSIV